MHSANCWYVPGCMVVTRGVRVWSQLSARVNAVQQVFSADVAYSRAARPPRSQAAEDVADEGARLDRLAHLTDRQSADCDE